MRLSYVLLLTIASLLITLEVRAQEEDCLEELTTMAICMQGCQTCSMQQAMEINSSESSEIFNCQELNEDITYSACNATQCCPGCETEIKEGVLCGFRVFLDGVKDVAGTLGGDFAEEVENCEALIGVCGSAAAAVDESETEVFGEEENDEAVDVEEMDPAVADPALAEINPEINQEKPANPDIIDFAGSTTTTSSARGERDTVVSFLVVVVAGVTMSGLRLL